MRRLIGLCVLLAPLACEDATSPAYDIGGLWTGSVAGGKFDVGITDTRGQLSGIGVWYASTGEYSFDLDGVRNSRTVSFTIRDFTVGGAAPEFAPVNFSGIATADTIRGQLNGGGFAAVQIDFYR